MVTISCVFSSICVGTEAFLLTLMTVLNCFVINSSAYRIPAYLNSSLITRLSSVGFLGLPPTTVFHLYPPVRSLSITVCITRHQRHPPRQFVRTFLPRMDFSYFISTFRYQKKARSSLLWPQLPPIQHIIKTGLVGLWVKYAVFI